MAVTRIKNNQITDATITAAKIASQTLVGSLFATDLTLSSNLSIIGGGAYFYSNQAKEKEREHFVFG